MDILRTFDLPTFIQSSVIQRSESLFKADLSTYHESLSEKIDGKSALVIGGAGTIGSNFIKSLLKFKPASLYVVDINENGLTELVRDLRSSVGYHIPEVFLTYPLNFGDAVFRKILRQKGPFDIVANFAAHKHVRSEKDQFSIEAMIDNNVVKAKYLLDLLIENPPQHFFCVSTDKAANPVNVMGASKKLMEEVILAYAQKMPITTARFANVAFSNGSLPFGFIERIMKKQPLSAPRDIKRYFVSPTEAGQICLLSCILGASGDIFFPKLKEENFQTFTHIAEELLAEFGYQPDYCTTEIEAKEKALNLRSDSKRYPVYFFSTDTSGEKSFEEFYTPNEKLDLARFEQLGVIKNAKRRDYKEVGKVVDHLADLFRSDQVAKQDIIALLFDFLPTFRHVETGKNLDQKM